MNEPTDPTSDTSTNSNTVEPDPPPKKKRKRRQASNQSTSSKPVEKPTNVINIQTASSQSLSKRKESQLQEIKKRFETFLPINKDNKKKKRKKNNPNSKKKS